MRPDDRDLDDEIRGHLALAALDRIERGEDPDAARRAAARDFGYAPAIRESMRRVWHHRWRDVLGDLGRDVRVGCRSLRRAPGLAVAVVVTLALGIGANAAIVSVVRGVLLRPLVNRGEDRIVYIRQSAPGIGAANTTFSVPEIADLTSRVATIAAFGEFSTIDFPLVGLGEPRVVRAGVVGGSYFEVMGLCPVLGRLLGPADDGPDATPAVVLTHRFWTAAFNRDAGVVGRVIRLGSRDATIVGVLEPSVPYPAETEVIANIVTSPHHLEATMVTERSHRMTELFGRLRPGATIDEATDELTAVHAAMTREHPDAFAPSAGVQLSITPLREQLAAPARTVLLLLLVAAGVVFVVACSNVANLILARSVRREGELAVRAALGATRGALRRTLLAESLVLCGAGATLGVVLAWPFVGVVSRFMSRFSARALDVTLDASLLGVGAGLALAAAVLLAFVPRLPASAASAGHALPAAGGRASAGTNRWLRTLATVQVACSFVLLAGAATLVAALVALQTTRTGYDMRQVLAIDVPLPFDTSGDRVIAFYEEATRRIAALPGVARVAAGSFVPWRDAGSLGPGLRFAVEGHTPAAGEDPPHARLRNVAPGFFDTLGVPRLAGRDFADEDDLASELVVIVSESVAARLFPDGDAVGHRLWWTDPYFARTVPRRIVGVVADVDDEHLVPGPAPTIYHPFRQLPFAGRLFVQAADDPYALVPDVTRVIHAISADQPVVRPATLADVRAEVIGPNRVRAVVVSGFAVVAVLVAMVGVSGVLAFSVSARTREFGVRLALGSSAAGLMRGVLAEGAAIAAIGIAAGAAAAVAFGSVASRAVGPGLMPSLWPALGAAVLLGGAAIAASLVPATRASRVDSLQALRSE